MCVHSHYQRKVLKVGDGTADGLPIPTIMHFPPKINGNRNFHTQILRAEESYFILGKMTLSHHMDTTPHPKKQINSYRQ